jgi:hypothetical protein
MPERRLTRHIEAHQALRRKSPDGTFTGLNPIWKRIPA